MTGGAGFIGSTLTDRLLASGYGVDVIDDLSMGSLKNLADARAAAAQGADFTFHNMDVRSEALTEIMVHRRPEVVFHLAAQADVRVSISRPVYDADVNILGTLRVLEAARISGVRKIVFAASGGTLYGPAERSELPLGESYPHKPLSPYGVSKKAGLDYLATYRELYQLEYCALALANVYGPRQDPNGEAGVVAIFAGLLAEGRQCTIYGDGEQTRDFVYVDDVVDAFVRAAERGSGLVANIGTGVQTSVNQLYQILAAQAGEVSPPRYVPERSGELRYNALDPSRAALHLGWKPWTALEDGMAAVLGSLGAGPSR